MTENQTFVATTALIYNLLDVSKKDIVSVHELSDFLSFLLKYLSQKHLLDKYSIIFDINEDHVERIALYDRNNIGYDSDTKELYLKAQAQRNTLARQHRLPDEILAGIHAYIGAAPIKTSPLTFHITQPMADRHPTQGKLENEYYTALVEYTGDLLRDMQNDSVNYNNLSAEAIPNDNDRTNPKPTLYIPNLNHPEQDRVILADKDQYLPMERIGALVEQLTMAQECMAELRKAIENMLPNKEESSA